MALKGQYAVLKYSHLGLTFTVTLCGSFFLGLKADEKFGTGSVFSLLGGAFGGVLGFYYLLREVQRLDASDDEAGGPKDSEHGSTEGKP